jgi:HD-GYP domain-containing protein (c-di-GMP phosphodiesterase class II)
MKFVDNLISIKYPTETEKKELWDVSGILKNRSNQEFKFDLRPLNKDLSKKGSFKTKADKMVFETISEWILVDIEELHNYIKQHKLKVVELEQLISKLEWNIILPKK